MLPNATKYSVTSDVKDALSAVYEVVFVFGHMIYSVLGLRIRFGSLSDRRVVLEYCICFRKGLYSYLEPNFGNHSTL